ncbi:MAG TPA: hypothetical protein VN429_09450 [Methanospirillum sp.]|uniref:hypothetical protein n=1 Tax=Methanospirillum sp. TaxID=45200 RepID=UPI002CDCAD4B|nr:hypothetical protein [Methanospirillum sp.]HWQ64627.1 hypothetical protein [Methanospirillum sp.]
MRWNYLATGSVLLILASLTGAEYLGTTISTDGTVHLCGSGEDANGSFVSRVMTVGSSELSRIITGEDSGTLMSVHGTGPVLFSDYTTKDRVSPAPLACVFLVDRNNAESRSHMFASGILERGSYTMSRVSYPDLLGESLINGSGFILLESGSEGNTTSGSEGFVSGNMTVHDTVRL